MLIVDLSECAFVLLTLTTAPFVTGERYFIQLCALMYMA